VDDAVGGGRFDTEQTIVVKKSESESLLGLICDDVLEERRVS
jgi:hypothetical protein